ncbi:hypothetical protein HDU86_007170 [Geranomyces michiganensis]|nr:hypothetical protein HDU86_007170 [Geranomyces michiganensis]
MAVSILRRRAVPTIFLLCALILLVFQVQSRAIRRADRAHDFLADEREVRRKASGAVFIQDTHDNNNNNNKFALGAGGPGAPVAAPIRNNKPFAGGTGAKNGLSKDAPQRTGGGLFKNAGALKVPEKAAAAAAAAAASVSGDGVGSALPPALASKDKRKLAYVFYVTNDQYACACLAIVASLKHVGFRADAALVALVTSGVSSRRLQQLRDMGIRTDTVDVVRSENSGADPTWKDSLTRLWVFKLVEFDRIIALDVDGTVVKPLDHLFDLPPAPLWAARAYWLPQPFFQSTLYVIQPSKQLYDAQIATHERIQHEEPGRSMFDMDMTNEAFSDSVALLPGSLALLNGVFKASAGATEPVYGTGTVADMAAVVAYVHFSEAPGGGYGKPWSLPGRHIATNPNSHPLFSQLFTDYWAREDELCT